MQLVSCNPPIERRLQFSPDKIHCNNLSFCSSFFSSLEKIIVQGYKALQLQYFFTAGPDEVKAWTIQKGFKAPQAAGRIHTDFEKGFIMAEVMKFEDFKEEGSEAAAKVKERLRFFAVIKTTLRIFLRLPANIANRAGTTSWRTGTSSSSSSTRAPV